MAKEPEKPARRQILTGTAQPVTNSVERARGYLKDRPEPSRPPEPTRRGYSYKRPEIDGEREPPAERETAEVDGVEETEPDK